MKKELELKEKRLKHKIKWKRENAFGKRFWMKHNSCNHML